MLVQIFKIITALSLVGILFILTTHREIIFKPKVKAYTQVEQKDNIYPTILENKEAIASNDPMKSTSSQQLIETITIVKQPIAIIKTIPKNSVYIPLEEGQSDTDNSYRPAISPCKVTMGYKIGRFDSNFGISQASFIKEIDSASLLWGTQVGKNLFTYNENGPLTINLIYDERQARTDNVNNLVLDIDNAKSTAETLKRTYEQEKIIYVGDSEQLTRDADIFKARYQIYTDKVSLYNAQGGAPRDIYDEMTKELEVLKQLSRELTIKRDALLIYMEKINLKVARYNELVVYINNLIEKSNALGAKKFTEGRFTPHTNTIDIYQYNDLIKLRRVIAHELGHVLGINHTESMQSIMYSVNSATSTTLSAEDIRELREVCPQ